MNLGDSTILIIFLQPNVFLDIIKMNYIDNVEYQLNIMVLKLKGNTTFWAGKSSTSWFHSRYSVI